MKPKLYRCEAAGVCVRLKCLDKYPHKHDAGCATRCEFIGARCKPMVDPHKVEVVVWDRDDGTFGFGIKMNPGKKPKPGYKHRKTALRAARRMIERINNRGLEVVE